jgi:hypothetical protein
MADVTPFEVALASAAREYPTLEIARVRADLQLITERGFDRGQDLAAKLETVVLSSA